jgi:hypothetical protein
LRSRIQALGLVLCFFFTTCDEGPNVNEFNYKAEVNVFALLLLNSEQTIVRVENTYRSLDKVPADRGIQDAQVVIKSQNQQVQLAHQGGGRYAETEEKLRLTPGVTYELTVRLADGREVEASCTMPAPPHITSPSDQGLVAAYESLRVSWVCDDPAPRYMVSLRGNINGYSAEASTDSLQMDFFPFYMAQPDIYVLKVASMDRNYYEYSRMADDEEPIWHVSGGIGVFGAMAYDQRVIIAE